MNSTVSEGYEKLTCAGGCCWEVGIDAGHGHSHFDELVGEVVHAADSLVGAGTADMAVHIGAEVVHMAPHLVVAAGGDSLLSGCQNENLRKTLK